MTTKLIWEEVSTEFTSRSAMIELWGDTSTGRTRFALSAPGSIALIHTGEKIAGIVEEFRRIKDIKQINCSLPGIVPGMDVKEVSALAVKVEKRFMEYYYEAISCGDFRTVIIDLHTDLWEVSRLGAFGKLKPDTGLPMVNYPEINARWNSLVIRGQNQDRVNIIWIGSSADEWAGSKKTGNRVRESHYSQLPVKCHVVLNMQRDSMNGRYKALVQKAWMGDKDWRDKYIDQDQLTFANVMSTFTDTEPEEWEE